MSGINSLILAAAAIGALGVLGWRWFEWSRVYHPRRSLEHDPNETGLSWEEVEFVAEDATRLYGWWFPAPNAMGTVLYCHGNGDNLGDLLWVAEDLVRWGVNVFLFDYRGYGRSRGWPTERGTYRDARAAFEVVRARYDDGDDPPVVALGRSLGGAVAAQLALEKPLRGLILESTFTSIPAVGKRMYPWLPVDWLCLYRYDTLSKMPRIRVPVLVAHSPEDGMIPLAQAEQLYVAAPVRAGFVRLSGLHHEAGWRHSPAYEDAVRGFLKKVLNIMEGPT